MECENCEGQNGRALFAMVALFAAALGIGAFAKHRRHRHQHEGPGGPDGHEFCADHLHHECGREGERRGGGRGRGHRPGRSRIDPIKMLEKRFASGEIDEDEFRRRRSVLQENAQ